MWEFTFIYMKKLSNFLWILLLSCYLITLTWKYLYPYWKIIFLLSISTTILLYVIKIISKRDGRIEYVLNSFIPKVLYLYASVNDFIVSLSLMFCLSFLTPLLIISFLERSKIIDFGHEFGIYTTLTFSSMIITFYGKRIVSLLNKYVVYNPSKKSINASENIVSEGIVKTMYFCFYFLALIISSIIKFQHINTGIISEKLIEPVIYSFTTYIALDRIVSAYRSFRNITNKASG